MSYNGLRSMIWVLERAFYWFRSVTTEVSAAFRAYECGDSLRFNWRESVNDDIFDPVGMVTRTAAVAVPIALSHPRVLFRFLWFVVHLVIPQTIRTL
jgi:hypothetical protein